MEKAILDRLQSYYEQSPSEQQLILKLVLEAANANPAAFIQLIHQQRFETVEDVLANNLPFFYEALALDLSNWDDFFLQEAHRLFALARTVSIPQKVLTHLDEFSFIQADEFKHRDALVALLCEELGSDKPVFRYYAASLLPDFIRLNDFKTIDMLRQLLNDPNWRIRYYVYHDLQDLKLLSEHDALSWVDRLRARIWSPYNLDL